MRVKPPPPPPKSECPYGAKTTQYEIFTPGVGKEIRFKQTCIDHPSSRNDSPRRDSSRKDSPRKESPRKDSSRKDSPRKDSSRKDSPRKDSPRRGSPRKESPRKESPRRGSPRSDSPRRGSPSYHQSHPKQTELDNLQMKLSGLKDEIDRINSDKGNTEIDIAENTIKMKTLMQKSKVLEASIRRLQKIIFKTKGGRRTTKKNKRSIIRRKYIKKTNKKKRNTKKKNTKKKNTKKKNTRRKN